MNHPQVLNLGFQEAHADMFDCFNHSSLHAEFIDSNTSMRFPSISYLHTLLMHHALQETYEGTVFSRYVHHSRFSILLSFLMLFIGFIQGLFSGLGIYVMAISLWTYDNIDFQSFRRITDKYPIFMLQGLRYFPLYLLLQTLPSSVIAYNHSYQGMSRIITKLKNRYILKSGKNKMHLLFTQKCIQDFFDRNSILSIA